jgi:uncharacterized membrane protein (DUF373 family)
MPSTPEPRNATGFDLRPRWSILSAYQRFEASVASVLTFVVGAVIVVALYRLIVGVVNSLLLDALNPLDHGVFQRVFGEIMTLLIALEFNHTLQYVVAGERGVIHMRTVILIAELALARKVIVMDLYDVAAGSLLALAAMSVALAITYWLIRDRDLRTTDAAQPSAR